MKLKLSYLAMATSALMFASCGGGPTLGDKDASRNDLIPAPVEASQTDVYKQNPDLPVITAKKDAIYDAEGKPLALRGISALHDLEVSDALEIGANVASLTGSNVVRLLVSSNTTAAQLKSALDKVVERNMVAIVSLRDASLRCTDDPDALSNAVKNLWLKDWIAVLSAEKFQSHLMINIADGWGPTGSYYTSYFSDYRTQIQRFRTAGFKSPLVIDAPNCGKNYRAFLNDGAQAFVDIDPEHNIVLSVQPDGDLWNTNDKLVSAFSQLDNIQIPYIVSSLAGSAVGGKAAVDHNNVMGKAMGDHAMKLYLPWVSTTDSVGYSAKLLQTTSLKDGAIVRVNAFIDKDYLEYTKEGIKQIPKGKTTIALYLKDISGNRLQLSQTTADSLPGNYWRSISATAPISNEVIDAANLMNGATTFDLANVAEVGIQVLANGKPVSVIGAIKFDDLEIYPGAPAPTLAVESTFNAGAGGWANPEWSPGKVTFADGYAKFTMKAGDWGLVMESPGWQSQEVLPKIDFKQTVFVDMKVFVPASYAGQTPSFTVNGNFGDDWKIEPSTGAGIVGGGDLKYGDWNNYRAVLKWSSSFDVSKPQNISVRMSGVVSTEPILVDTITITQQLGQRMKTVTTTQYKATFAADVEGFVNAGWDDGKATLKVEDGALLVTVPEGDKGAINNADIGTFSDIDTKGNTTIKMKIFIPADWAGKAFSIKPFMQNWSGTTAHYQYAELKVADLEPGAWKEIELKPTAFPAGYNRGSLNMFGFQFEGVPAGTIKFDDIEIIGDVQVPDALPIFTMGFDTQEQYESVKFDFAMGSLTESSVVNARSFDYKIRPFGWLAAPWIDNADAALDLVGTIDTTDPKNPVLILSARGEEIILGALGIKNTSQLAGFPPVPGLPVKTN